MWPPAQRGTQRAGAAAVRKAETTRTQTQGCSEADNQSRSSRLSPQALLRTRITCILISFPGAFCPRQGLSINELTSTQCLAYSKRCKHFCKSDEEVNEDQPREKRQFVRSLLWPPFSCSWRLEGRRGSGNAYSKTWKGFRCAPIGGWWHRDTGGRPTGS